MSKVLKTSAAKCAAAIRHELKKKFPGVKFSVTSETFSMGDSVRISWTNGPTTDEVEKKVGKYQYGHFDGMEDIYEISNRRDNIPQAKYVTTNRQKGEDVLALEPVLAELLGPVEWHNRPESVLYRLFEKTSIPAGAKITGVQHAEETNGSQLEDFYRIVFEVADEVSQITPVKVEPGPCR